MLRQVGRSVADRAGRRLASLAALVVLLAGSLVAASPLAAQEYVPPVLQGFLFEDRLTSKILDQTLPYRIYLPPGYFASDQRYPVVYMLHGAGGDYMEWSYSFLPDRLDEMILDGEVQPMIVVMPEGGGRTYWANWADGGPRWADYVVQEVVPEIDLRYRTLPSPESRAIGGLSMGGAGALQLAMNHPDVFGVVGAHSPSVRVEPDPDLYFLVGQAFLDQNPLWLALNRPGLENLKIWVDVGTDDWWRPNVEELRDTLDSAGLKFTYRVFPGTHEAEYWIDHLPLYLAFYSATMLAADPAPPIALASARQSAVPLSI